MRISPPVGSRAAVISFISVDFPAPLGPKSPIRQGLPSDSETSRSAALPPG